MAKIIVAEDEAIVALATKMMLKNLSHEIIIIVSGAEDAVREVDLKEVDLVVMDIKLKGTDEWDPGS
jgi:CheY-like chemotaxis protein